MSDHHEMRKVTTHDSGAEEWLCDECGRHLKFQLEPFQRTVLSNGNECIPHSGNSFGSTFSVNVETNDNNSGGTVLH